MLGCLMIANLIIGIIALEQTQTTNQTTDVAVSAPTTVLDFGEPHTATQITRSMLVSDWWCYMGRPQLTKDGDTDIVGEENRLGTGGRDYFQTADFNSIVYTDLRNADSVWLSDPTGGMQHYLGACADKDLLLQEVAPTEDIEMFPSFMTLRATTAFWNLGPLKYSGQSGPSVNLEVLRLESKDVYPTGSVYVLHVNNVPHTNRNGPDDAAWPAFWMLGTRNPGDWKVPLQPGIARGSTWPFAGGGEIDFFETSGGLESTDGHTEDFMSRFQTLHAPSTCLANASVKHYNKTVGGPGAMGECEAGQLCDCQFGMKEGVCPTDTTNCEYKQDNGCGVPINMGIDASWRWRPQTWIFVHHPSSTTKGSGYVETYTLKQDTSINIDSLRAKHYLDENGLTMTFKDQYGSRLDSTWAKTEYSQCMGVFENMHPIINTAVCGQWGGRSYAQMEDCGTDVLTQMGFSPATQEVPYFDPTFDDAFFNTGYHTDGTPGNATEPRKTLYNLRFELSIEAYKLK